MTPRIGRLPSIDPQAARSIVEVADYAIDNLASAQAHRQRQECTDRQRVLLLLEGDRANASHRGTIYGAVVKVERG